jgi:hypothetical protein
MKSSVAQEKSSADTSKLSELPKQTGTKTNSVLQPAALVSATLGSPPQTPLATKQIQAVPALPVSAPFTGILAPLNIVTGVVSTLFGLVGLGPSMTGSPAAPAQAPLLWTMLAWARHEFEQTLFGGAAPGSAQLPVASLVQSPNLLVRHCRDTAP